MRNILTAAVAQWLVQEGTISDSDLNLFAYAAYCFLFGLVPILLAVLFGILFGMVRESLLLIFPFMLLRKFSGGFHFKSATLCLVCSALLIALALIGVRWLMMWKNSMVLTEVVILSIISLFVNSPIESAARKLTDKEKARFRGIVRFLTGMILVLYILLLLFNQPQKAIPIGMGIIITAFLQIPSLLITLVKHHIPSQ